MVNSVRSKKAILQWCHMIIIASQIPASRVNNNFCFQFDNNENIKVPHWQPFAKKFHRSPADSPHKDSVMQEAFSMDLLPDT